MNDDYEPALVKARKLAVLADPANGGSPGEIENAQRALEKLCRVHGIDADKLDVRARRRFALTAISPNAKHKPEASMDLAKLAVQTLRYVLGEDTKGIRDLDTVKEKRRFPSVGRKKAKSCEVWVISAMLTPLEAEEWQACYSHYAPELIETLKQLKKQAAAARKAVKFALSAFINAHSIFPPDAQEGDDMDPERLQALLMAMRGVQGERWQKGPRLEQADFMLS